MATEQDDQATDACEKRRTPLSTVEPPGRILQCADARILAGNLDLTPVDVTTTGFSHLGPSSVLDVYMHESS